MCQGPIKLREVSLLPLYWLITISRGMGNGLIKPRKRKMEDGRFHSCNYLCSYPINCLSLNTNSCSGTILWVVDIVEDIKRQIQLIHSFLLLSIQQVIVDHCCVMGSDLDAGDRVINRQTVSACTLVVKADTLQIIV